MVGYLQEHWLTMVIWAAMACVLLLIGRAWGARDVRKQITGDFDAIIRRARGYMVSGQLMKLDQFLHELTEDEPYVPTMKMLAENMVRMGGDPDARPDNKESAG